MAGGHLFHSRKRGHCWNTMLHNDLMIALAKEWPKLQQGPWVILVPEWPKNHVSAIMTYIKWCKEHPWNVSILQRAHLSNLVFTGKLGLWYQICVRLPHSNILNWWKTFIKYNKECKFLSRAGTRVFVILSKPTTLPPLPQLNLSITMN